MTFEKRSEDREEAMGRSEEHPGRETASIKVLRAEKTLGSLSNGMQNTVKE